MTHNEHERSSDMPRDPALEEAFGVLIRHVRAPLGFHARVMAKIAAASPTFRDRLVRWLLPLWQPPLAGEPVTAPSAVFHTPLSPSHQQILMHRLVVAEKKLEAATKMMRDLYEELREIEALVADLQSED